MCEQMVNEKNMPQNGILSLSAPGISLDRNPNLLYNKRINIRAFADRSGLLAMALFLTVDIFDVRIIGVKI